MSRAFPHSVTPFGTSCLPLSFPTNFTQRTSKSSRQQLITISSEQTGTWPLIAYASKRVQCPTLLGPNLSSQTVSSHEFKSLTVFTSVLNSFFCSLSNTIFSFSFFCFLFQLNPPFPISLWCVHGAMKPRPLVG